MSIAVMVLVAMVAGFIGGLMAAAFMEAYLQRQESNKIGEYEAIHTADRRAR